MFTDEELVEKLIDEVEKRPVLFNKLCKEYSDANLKNNKWDEVTMELVGVVRWGEMSPEEKTNARKEVQKRWLNLRNCFSRELRLQRETKSGQSAKKRRTYVYFERLLFLLPTIEPRETASNISNESDDGDGSDSPNTERMRPPRPSPNNNKSFEQSLLTMLERKFNVEQNETTINDEDHNFALSLVPMLQRLSVYDKIDVKMQILNIFKEKNAPQPELRKIRIINHHIIPPKPTTNPGRGPPQAISPGPFQTQHAIPQDRTQGPSQAYVYSPPSPISPGSFQTQQEIPQDRTQGPSQAYVYSPPPPPPISPGSSQIPHAIPQDGMQQSPSPSTNESVQSYYSNYFADSNDYE